MKTQESYATRADAIVGAILGGAVGDALGLPYENLSKSRGVRLLGEPDRMRFFFGYGMVSDDTEHACMVAEVLCREPTDPQRFASRLGWKLRWWIASLPAGVGFATLKACMKLWIGFPSSKSGVYSAGNGPAMRSAVLGAALDDLHLLRRFVEVSTRLTHTDPKACEGAYAAALAAWCARRGRHMPTDYFGLLQETFDLSGEFRELLLRVEASVTAQESTEVFAEHLGCRDAVSGYIYRTIPVVLHAWLSHPTDYPLAVMSVIRCGGDTDTTAAILGGILGAGVGREGLPEAWLAYVREYPRSVGWMTALSQATASAVKTGNPTRPPFVLPGVVVLRNVAFFGVVLLHLFRRLLPPYATRTRKTPQ